MHNGSGALDRVLSRLDADLDASVERLFAWLRIPSISTDPAYAPHCRTAADWLQGELRGLGFDASVRDTAGHPVVMGHRPRGNGPHVLFYGHYDVQPVDPLDLWDTPPFEPKLATTAGRPQGDLRPRRLRRQGAGAHLRRGLPGLEGGRRRAAGRRHGHGRGRGGERVEAPARLRRGEPGRAEGGRGARLRHRHVGPQHAGDHRLAARPRLFRGRGALRRPGPPFRPVRRRGPEPDPRARRASSPTCTMPTAASRCRTSTTACRTCRRTCWSSGGASTSRRRSSWARSASRSRRGRRGGCSSSRSSRARPAT